MMLTAGKTGYENVNGVLGALSFHLQLCFSTGVCLVFLCRNTVALSLLTSG